MGKTVCVICSKEKQGFQVADDPVLSTIREAKKRLGRATGNKLVVCEPDLKAAQEKRARFEKNLMLHGALAAAVFFLLLLSSPSVLSLAVGLFAALFVLALSLVSYFPKVSAPDAPRAKG